MDPHARATTWQLVRDLRDRGVTVLLTTHAMDEAEHLCDRVAIVNGGKLAALGSPAELTQDAVAAEIWIATGFERRYGVLKRLGSTPLSRGGLLVAKTATVLALEVLQIVLVVLVGIAIGWSPPGGLVPAVVLLLIGTIAFAGIGMLMAGT